MPIAILIHGFNVFDGGRATVGRLRPFFADRKVPYLMVNYGWFGIGRTYVKNDNVARRVAGACRTARELDQNRPIIVVGHSNGCAITWLAAREHGVEIDRAVFINPALDEDAVIPPGIRSLHVWHSPDDKPVAWSRKLPFHPWGNMGAIGYQGPADERVENFDKQSGYRAASSKAHSDVFSDELLPFFGPLIAGRAVDGMEMRSL